MSYPIFLEQCLLKWGLTGREKTRINTESRGKGERKRTMGRKHIKARNLPKSQVNKRYQKRGRRRGLCVWCSRKASKGKTYCEKCIARRWERWRALHPLFCAECGKLVKPEERYSGNRFHKLCAQRRRARRAPLVHRSAVFAYQRRHRKLGLCRSCPKKAFKGGRCRNHYRLAKESAKRAAGRI